LKKAGIRVTVDDRDNHNPGWKFNHWELKGVPIRMELGKKDFEKDEVRVCIRHNGKKMQVKVDGIAEEMKAILD
jgi:prolyl-tRNA synthetase